MDKIAVLSVNNNQSQSQISQFEPEINPLPYLGNFQADFYSLRKNESLKILEKIKGKYDVYLNLCDGAEGDDRPGIEVVRFLEDNALAFTGAGSTFYEPSRFEMKHAAKESEVFVPDTFYVQNLDELKNHHFIFPCIVKHPNSYSSIGLTRNSVVDDQESLINETGKMILNFNGALIESYIPGDEYTALVVSESKNKSFAFYPAKIVFPNGETFKHFDLKWKGHCTMKYIPCPDLLLAEKLMKKSMAIYEKMNGTGYARFDYRVDKNGEIYFIELNPNCSLFYPEDNASSADEILSFSMNSMNLFVEKIISYSLQRFR